MSDTLLRQWAMLRLIPRQPRKIDTARLKSGLEEQGYDIDLRTIQRDLNKLSTTLPLLADNGKPQGWSWEVNAQGLDIPALDPQAALTFNLVERYMKHLLPSTTLAYLQPWFSAASGVLDQHGNGLALWPDKIRVLPRGLPQKAPTINPAVTDAVYQGVLQERQLEITYRKNQGEPESRTHIVHPLALVVRDRLIYLACVFDGYSNLRQLAVHRMESAVLKEDALNRPKDFSIDTYIAEGEFGIVLNPQNIVLEAEFFRHVAIHLRESPISDNQVIEDIDEDNVLLRATVADTLELRQWLKSFGDEVAVVGPAALRQEFQEMAKNIHNYYKL
jgi:predicted DNA-binding transcriptional regulator YafY